MNWKICLPFLRTSLLRTSIAGMVLVFMLTSCVMSDLEPPGRYALVYGVGEYDYLPVDNQLPNATTDGREMAQLFREQGITVLNENVGGWIEQAQFWRDIDRAADTVSNNDILFIYFAGHGLEAFGESLIIFSNWIPDNLNSDDLKRKH